MPGCTEVTVTVGSQAIKIPTEGLAFMLDGMPTFAVAETLPDPGSDEHYHTAYRPPGLAALSLAPSESALAQSGGMVTVTRVISYTYDPLNRIISADYSTGEQFQYAYDPVGNRIAMTATHESRTTQYEYDAANRLVLSLSKGLTTVDDVTYTWDDRGNLVSDGTFTYTYNTAGRMVRAKSVTVTLVYTYNAAGLRVAQSVIGFGEPAGDMTSFAWDWASGLPEMLSEGGNLYLVGHETLGQWDGADWAYYLPDALGSVRQATDDTGAVTGSREWTPFGVEVGAGQAGLGYTGEWWDTDVGLEYLRARWYDGGVGRFTTEDPAPGYARIPRSLHIYVYAWNNPVNLTDPAGLQIQPPVDCEPGDICYTGTTGPYVLPSSPAPAVISAHDMWRLCEQYRARLALGIRDLRPPSQSDLIIAALCGGCYEPPQPDTYIWDPLGRELAGPITVDSGWYYFSAAVLKGYGKRLGGPIVGVTSVFFSSRMEATFVFYERGTTIEVRDWYNTKDFIWVQPWLGYLSLNRDVEVATTLRRRFGPYSLGEVQGAQEGSGNLPYRLSFYGDGTGRPDEVRMRLAVVLPNTRIPVELARPEGGVREYFIWSPRVSLP